jgi:hypothetical protein
VRKGEETKSKTKNQNNKKATLFSSHRPRDTNSVLYSSSAPFPGFRQHETQCSYSEQQRASASQPEHENGRDEVVAVAVVAVAPPLFLPYLGQQPVTVSTRSREQT